MERTTSARTSAELEQAAGRALQAGDFATARGLLDAWVRQEPGHLGAWLRRAAVCRQQGDTAQAFESLSSALKIDPRCFPALLMVATLLEREGDLPAAARQYDIAIAQAPPDERLDVPTRAALEHGRQLVAKHARELRDFIHAELDVVRGECTVSEQRRVETFVDTTLRLRKRYVQEPMEYCYPGMPSIEFYDRAMFPWLAELEAATPDIRRELLSLLAEGAPGFSPYVNYAEHMPLDQWRELNRSPRWTAWHSLRTRGAYCRALGARACDCRCIFADTAGQGAVALAHGFVFRAAPEDAYSGAYRDREFPASRAPCPRYSVRLRLSRGR